LCDAVGGALITLFCECKTPAGCHTGKPENGESSDEHVDDPGLVLNFPATQSVQTVDAATAAYLPATRLVSVLHDVKQANTQLQPLRLSDDDDHHQQTVEAVGVEYLPA
jgi:hypothetical protein